MHDDLALLVSELVANAATQGRPAVALHLIVTDALVRVDVFDHRLPRTRPAASTTVSGGRGLAGVDTTAKQWGIEAESPRNEDSVWFELRLGRPQDRLST